MATNEYYLDTRSVIDMESIINAIEAETSRISNKVNKIVQEKENNNMKEVLFLAPSWQYTKTVISNLSKTFDKKKIPYAATSKKFETNSVRVTFVCSDPLKWTPDMFKDKRAIFGKKELLDITRKNFFDIMPRHPNMSLEKYIIENTVDPTVCTEPTPPTSYLPEIKNVHFNGRATVVLWEDGTKTVVMCQEGDIYSEETGLALCIAKKAFGNMPNFNNIFRKWVPEEDHAHKWTEFFVKSIQQEYKARKATQRAYDMVVDFRDAEIDEDAELDIEELIGYLGEALE